MLFFYYDLLFYIGTKIKIISFDWEEKKGSCQITQHTHIIYTPKILPVKKIVD